MTGRHLREWDVPVPGEEEAHCHAASECPFLHRRTAGGEAREAVVAQCPLVALVPLVLLVPLALLASSLALLSE